MAVMQGLRYAFYASVALNVYVLVAVFGPSSLLSALIPSRAALCWARVPVTQSGAAGGTCLCGNSDGYVLNHPSSLLYVAPVASRFFSSIRMSGLTQVLHVLSLTEH